MVNLSFVIFIEIAVNFMQKVKTRIRRRVLRRLSGSALFAYVLL